MRTNGILLPIFSLSSPYGIGTLGKEAFDFIDFLKEAGCSYWQILPVGPTGFGDSPYQSPSAFAGNPYFIDLRILCREGWLQEQALQSIDFGKDPHKVDYEKLYLNRFEVLRVGADRFLENAQENTLSDFENFCEENSFWLDSYALFSALHDRYHCAFYDWPKEYRTREKEALKRAEAELSSDIAFYKILQYWFFSQWQTLHDYAKKAGVGFIGDMPIYVAPDSADVWAHPEIFLLDENGRPSSVAGCPPDAFSADGQLWGNPLYDWSALKETDYAWWCERLKFAGKLYDVVRIDHFRAFDAYFSIPTGEKTAKNGVWKQGPGEEFFQSVHQKIGKLHIIAEDLGQITDSVRALLKSVGYPGMAVLEFAFDPNGDSRYLPHNIEKNSVVYTGTHDNDTIEGYLKNAPKSERRFCIDYLRLSANEGYNWGMMRAAMATAADTCILQMQDFMGLSEGARINTPGTSEGNWQWRMEGSCINSWLAGIIRQNTALYRRLGNQKA